MDCDCFLFFILLLLQCHSFRSFRFDLDFFGSKCCKKCPPSVNTGNGTCTRTHTRDDLIEMCSFYRCTLVAFGERKLYYVVFECVSFVNFPLIQVQTHTQTLLLSMAISMSAITLGFNQLTEWNGNHVCQCNVSFVVLMRNYMVRLMWPLTMFFQAFQF